jgi:hypothetical protein
MFIIEWIARLLYGNDAVDKVNKKPRKKPRTGRRK